MGIILQEPILQITIGADELILWMRKNKIANNKNNQTLGRELYNLIVEKLGGTAGKQDCPSYWKHCDVNIDSTDWEQLFVNEEKIELPITSQQYSIDINKLPDLYTHMQSL